MPVKKTTNKKKIGPLPPKLRLVKEKQIGKVLHYFNHIKVAVIKLKEPIKIGDTIKIIGGNNKDFKQKITSMQMNHKKVALAKKGQEVGIKVKNPVREGYKVHKS